MPAHHSQARKLNRAAMQHKTRFCRFFQTEEGCANGASCAFAHGTDELQLSTVSKDSASCNSDDSTSVCSEETSLGSVSSTDVASLCEVLPPSSRRCWADADDDEDDEWQSMWAPPSQPEMHQLSIAAHLPPSSIPAVAKTPSKTERRELAATTIKAKRAALTNAVLEGLLRQAQAPYVYEE